MSITHSFVNPKSDGGDATLVRPSDWNAGHVITGFNAAFIGASVYNTTTQAITTGGAGDQVITMDTEVWDTDGFHSLVTNTSRFTIPAGLGGKYLLIGGGGFEDPESTCQIYFFKNGSAGRAAVGGGMATNQRRDLEVIEIWDLVAGDYVELVAYHNAGANRNFGSGVLSYFQMFKLDSGKVGGGIGARVTKSANQTLTNNVETKITWNQVTRDTDLFFVDASDRFLIPAGLGGSYIVVAQLAYDGNAAGVRSVEVYKNGTFHGEWNSEPDADTNGWRPGGVWLLDLVAGDYIECFGYQTSGGDLDVSSSGLGSYFSIARLDSGSSAYTGPHWGSGAAFPSGPTSGQRFTRTDRNIDYFWNGTRWLTTTQYVWVPTVAEQVVPHSTTGTVQYGSVVAGDYDVWLETWYASTNVLTTNNGSNFWTVTLADADGTSLGSFNTSADAATTRINHKTVVNALLGTAFTTAAAWIQITHAKTLSPGDIYSFNNVTYRLVG